MAAALVAGMAAMMAVTAMASASPMAPVAAMAMPGLGEARCHDQGRGEKGGEQALGHGMRSGRASAEC